MKPIKEAIIPNMEAIRKGDVVYAVKPSTARFISDDSFHLVVPLSRSSYSYLIPFLRNPIQQYIPLVFR